MNLNHIQKALELMGIGMIGIFIVTIVIYFFIKILLKAFPAKNNNL